MDHILVIIIYLIVNVFFRPPWSGHIHTCFVGPRGPALYRDLVAHGGVSLKCQAGTMRPQPKRHDIDRLLSVDGFAIKHSSPFISCPWPRFMPLTVGWKPLAGIDIAVVWYLCPSLVWFQDLAGYKRQTYEYDFVHFWIGHHTRLMHSLVKVVITHKPHTIHGV